MNQISRWLFTIVVLTGVAFASNSTGHCQEANQNDKPVLTIGSKAPALNIEHWVLNGEGKFKPVTDFEKGKIYVVEFWATSCGPCIASMPHIAELQTRYADKGVQIISISDEDLETVQNFLKREFGPDKTAKKTYKDVTKGYCLTTDPDGSSARDFTEACELVGIPIAFIVGKDQHIEWIGRPVQMDDPLEQIVAGKWNRAAYAEQYKEARYAKKLMDEVTSKVRSGDVDGSLQLLDTFLAASKNPEAKLEVQVLKFQIMIQAGNQERMILETAKAALEESANDVPLINMITWMIHQAEKTRKTQNKELVKLARSAAEKAIAKADAGYLSNLLYTVAHLEFLDGDAAKALETLKLAIGKASSDSEREQLSVFLKELEEAVAGKKSGK